MPIDMTFVDYQGPVVPADWLNNVNAKVNGLANTSTLGLGDALLGVKSPLAGGVDRTQHEKNGDTLTVQDFGAVGDNTTDDTEALQAALTAATGGKVLFIPGGFTYLISDTLTIPDGVSVRGAGYGSAIRQTVRGKNVFSAGNNNSISDLRLIGDGVNSGGTSPWGFNNGINIVGKKGVTVFGCWLTNFEYNGIYIENAENYTIANNTLWGQLYSINSGADIIVYSTVAGARGKIADNFSFSNNSNGIYVNALGLDTDIVITGNMLVTLDPVTFAVISSGSLLRRHGMILGYVGAGGGRIVCSGNFASRTRQTGIYWQGASSTTGSVLISGNYIKDVAVNAVEPALAGGIYLAAQGKADVVVGNIVDGMSQAGVITAAGIMLVAGNVGVSAENNTLISGNSVYNSRGHGLYIGSNAQNAKVVHNTFSVCDEAYIIVTPDAGFAGGGYMDISGNRGFGITKATYGIYADIQSSAIQFDIADNTLVGFDNTTATTANSGIFIRNWSANILCRGNKVERYYNGVGSDSYCNVRSTNRFRGNRFKGCNVAYQVGYSTGGNVITEGDILVSTTNYQSPALLAGNRAAYPGMISENNTATVFFNAAMTAGSWLVGDRVQQSVPAVGSPKGWMCTVAGSPGTWVSEGNLL